MNSHPTLGMASSNAVHADHVVLRGIVVMLAQPLYFEVKKSKAALAPRCEARKNYHTPVKSRESSW
jgi:hypothetical protein